MIPILECGEFVIVQGYMSIEDCSNAFDASTMTLRETPIEESYKVEVKVTPLTNGVASGVEA